MRTIGKIVEDHSEGEWRRRLLADDTQPPIWVLVGILRGWGNRFPGSAFSGFRVQSILDESVAPDQATGLISCVTH